MTPKGEELYARALEVLPGGVSSPVRAFGSVESAPILAARGEGAYLIDVDGVRYLDLLGSWGPLILGHAHPAVVRAVQEAAERGMAFGLTTEYEVALAEQVTALVPSVEQVRFVSSGTEATMTAIRLARAVTGRDLIIKFDGGYHGHADSFLIQAGSGLTTLGIASSPGVPRGLAQLTLSLPYNDTERLAEEMDSRGNQVAAVIVEPVAANMGVVPPEPGFLEALRDLTSEAGSLLIFDEVITGFRLGLGGAQGRWGIRPDLTTFGKILGGGLPIGAVGGSEELMSELAPAGPVYQAGTLSGNPLTMAAGLATLQVLEADPPYQALAGLAESLVTGLADVLETAGVPCQINQVGSLFTPFFTTEPVVDWSSARKADKDRYARFFREMSAEGILFPPSPFEAASLSVAHEWEEVGLVIDATKAVAPRLLETPARG